MFSLPARQASRQVEVWRKLRSLGALPLPGSGYLLPNSAQNGERMEWLAGAIRSSEGEASVAQVEAIDKSCARAVSLQDLGDALEAGH